MTLPSISLPSLAPAPSLPISLSLSISRSHSSSLSWSCYRDTRDIIRTVHGVYEGGQEILQSRVADTCQIALWGERKPLS